MTSRQLLPLSGAASVVLIVASFIVVGETPDLDAPMSEVVSFYTDNDSSLQFGAALLALGAFFFLLFSTTVSTLLRRDPARGAVAANFSLAGGIVFAVGATIFAGLAFTAGDTVDDIGPATLQTLHVLEMDMFFTVAVGTAAFLLGTGVGALKTALLPRWLAWVAIVIGVIALTPAGFFGFLALGIWTLIASVMLAMQAGAAPSPGVD
jgi:Domain of unknown function (DUF4386)